MQKNQSLGILFVICGGAAIATGILGKGFYLGDVLSGNAYKQKSSRFSGRLIFIVAGVFLAALGIKALMGAR